MKDRPYQTRMFNQIREAIGNGHKRILVVLPTGGGKGVCTARIMQMTSEKGHDSVFFAAQRELITQIAKHLGNFSVPYRTIMSGVADEYDTFEDFMKGNHISLVAKDTLWARAFRNSKIEIPPAKIVHIDECHASLSRTYQSIMEKYADSIVIGWTATPCRSDNKPLGQYYDVLIQGATYKELQDDEFLVPVRVIAPDRPDLKGCKVSRGDYSKGDLERRMNRDEMVGSIVKEWLNHAQGRSTVCFAAGISHSIHIRNLFRAEGISAEHIDGTMPIEERDSIMERARSGEVRVVTNYGVLHTGVDVPQWKYLICARPTKSFALWRQMGGRIQRPFAGHDHCVIQDHSDNALVMGFPDEDVEWEINGDGDIAKKHREKKAREKSEGKETGDPYRCEKCHAVYRGYRCPSCGHRPEEKGKAIKMKAGDLKELERKKANREATPMDKQKFWDECLGWAIGGNKLVGAAAHRYKERFGVFPNSEIENVPRSSQWKMRGRDFHKKVIKPAREQARREMQQELLQG